MSLCHISQNKYILYLICINPSPFDFWFDNSQTATMNDEEDHERITNKMKNKNTIVETIPKSNEKNY